MDLIIINGIESKMNLQNFPIIVLEDLQSLLSDLREVIRENHEFIEEIENHDKAYIFIKSKHYPSFIFYIDKASLNNANNTIFSGSLSPESAYKTTGQVLGGYSGVVISRFHTWLSILKRYQKINLNDSIVKQYEEELFNYLQIVDDDADEKAFELEQQVMFLEILDEIDKINENDENPYNEIIRNEIIQTKAILSSASKNGVMRKLSRIFAYAWKAKISLLKIFVDVFKKEMIKKAIWKGLENLPRLFEILNNNIGPGDTMI